MRNIVLHHSKVPKPPTLLTRLALSSRRHHRHVKDSISIRVRTMRDMRPGSHMRPGLGGMKQSMGGRGSMMHAIRDHTTQSTEYMTHAVYRIPTILATRKILTTFAVLRALTIAAHNPRLPRLTQCHARPMPTPTLTTLLVDGAVGAQITSPPVLLYANPPMSHCVLANLGSQASRLGIVLELELGEGSRMYHLCLLLYSRHHSLAVASLHHASSPHE